jgi:hypothetical protein
MQSFFSYSKINDKDSKDQNSNQCEMPNIFVFQYKKNENARTEHQLYIKALLCIDRDNPSRVSRSKKTHPKVQGKSI